MANREDLTGLLRLVDDLQRANEAQRKRIVFLEKRLAQRFESTRQDYRSKLKFLARAVTDFSFSLQGVPMF